VAYDPQEGTGMTTDLWQQATIKHLTELLEADEAVRGLVLIGSYAQPNVQPDAWSDIDLILVVDAGEMERFYPTTDWLKPVGEIYALSQTGDEHCNTTRVCLTDCRRIDFVIAPEPELGRIDRWELNPFCHGARCLFSRSAALDAVLERAFISPTPEPISAEQLERISNDFWFKGMLAVGKVARNDLLVALHLSLDMIRDCCVLGMMLRDRDAGTKHHRDGGAGHAVVAELEEARQPYTARGILHSIERSSIAFDRLATQLSDGYQEGRHTLLEWLAHVRDGFK